jgi:hypothetical protein
MLRQRVETLEQSQRQNPLSIELLIGSAKRFLPKPEHRIQLEELLTQETDRVLAQLDAADFAPPAQWDQTAFRAHARKYEAVTEALASMAGVLGRWGDDNEFSLVVDTIRSLHAQAEKIGSGLTLFLSIRSYPAVLVFTAYGLGLARAGRWSALHRLFDAVINWQHREPVRAVESLFLWSWKGTDHDAWKQIEGLECRTTPLSDHLLTLFSEWGKRFVGPTPDFELMFERFEMLGSLAHLERNNKADVQQALAGNPQQGWARMPVGRAGWHNTIAEKLVVELQAEPMKGTLIEAGFGKGDPEFIDLFVQNFRRMQW